jgi:hypothetical protein
MDMELPSVEYCELTCATFQDGTDHQMESDYFKLCLKARYRFRDWTTWRIGKLESAKDGLTSRILTPWFAQKQNEGYPKVNWHKFDLTDSFTIRGRTYRNEHVDNRGSNPKFARKIAAESTV